MARITPRFLTRRTAASYRHTDEVPAEFGACMSGHRDRGEVGFSLTRDEPGEPLPEGSRWL